LNFLSLSFFSAVVHVTGKNLPTLLSVTWIISRLALGAAVPYWRAELLPASAAAEEFGVAGVFFVACPAVRTLMDNGYTDSAMRYAHDNDIRIDTQAVALLLLLHFRFDDFHTASFISTDA
jgi:hypothetical protein